MKVNFMLWGTGRTGGTRVLFEVATRLAKRDHEVTITSLGPPRHYWFPLSRVIYPELKYLIYVPLKKRASISAMCNWLLGKVKAPYDVDPTKLLALSAPDDVDVNVATFCFTAYAVYRSGKGCPFYYIQHYEPLFFASDPYLYQMAKETYYLPLKWIVNSSWANVKLRSEVGRDGPVVLSGVDTSVFFPRVMERKGDAKVIIALGKGDKIKGLSYLFKALDMIHKGVLN